jgi:hypothetical protein
VAGAAVGQFLPPRAATDRSSMRLLWSVTCRKSYAGDSAVAVARVPSHQQPHSAGKLPSKQNALNYRLALEANSAGDPLQPPTILRS